MKKIISLCTIIFSSIIIAQSYNSYLNDNYSGVHAVINNPANIVDSRMRTDINLFGISGLITNDYAAINFGDLLEDPDNFDFNKSGSRNPSSNNNAAINLDVLGPSFMFNITPKHSIAIFSRARSITNLKDINGEAVEKFEDGFDQELDYNVLLGDVNSKTNSWAEIGLSYATILMNKEKHLLKGGLSAKYLQGAGYAVGNGKNISVDYKRKGTTILVTDSRTGTVVTEEVPTLSSTGTFSYGYTKNLEDEFNDFKILENSTGFGFDLGFTYEWRPNIDKYAYTDLKGKPSFYKDANKYKVKAGLSITDIGSIDYKDAKIQSYNLTKTVTENDYNNFEGIQDKLDNLYTLDPTKTVNSIKASLPTALHLNIDWNINNHFYVNLDTNFDIAGDDIYTNNIANTYTLAPRYESKWFSFALPLSSYEYSGFNAGFGLRAGPLYLGSGALISNLFKDESKSTDFYLGLKIPVYQSRPKDKDGDGVYDKVDKCRKTPGDKDNEGCPWGDKDNDGVTDNIDKCPDTAGEKENNGCPWGDKDNDGIKDNVDACPTTSGLEQFSGCPDTDNDGVKDSEDKCPKVVGDKKFNGCPADTDGDGIIDTEDKCPKISGVKSENGCPKKEVKKVEVIEVKPVVSKEVENTINSYAKSIYFNSAKSTFKTGVKQKLDEILSILNQYPSANFIIEGHTDSQGAAQTNLKLSERRAKAVLNYFVKMGIDSSRLSSFGYGEDYPIDTNSTRAGRANNRRVEIRLRK